jgi:hypothetical protein
MRRHFRNSPVAVKVLPEVGAPTQLVAYAAKVWERDADGFDEVWRVFDVDEFGTDVETAIAAARRAKISLAISNPCFEFWLLLHFAEHGAWLDGAGAAKAKLCQHLAGYDKTEVDFGVFAPGVQDAIDRGRRLSESGRSHTDNPSTTMWQLARAVVG